MNLYPMSEDVVKLGSVVIMVSQYLQVYKYDWSLRDLSLALEGVSFTLRSTGRVDGRIPTAAFLPSARQKWQLPGWQNLAKCFSLYFCI